MRLLDHRARRVRAGQGPDRTVRVPRSPADYRFLPRTTIRTSNSPSWLCPGDRTPRLALEQIRQGGHSDCRNRRLQKMFLMLGIGEQAGSGFSKILRAWCEEQWQFPGLTEGSGAGSSACYRSLRRGNGGWRKGAWGTQPCS